MKKTAQLCVLIAAAIMCLTAGCSNCCQNAPDKATKSGEGGAGDAAGATDQTLFEIDRSAIEIENLDSPEGVVNEFFKTFFSGDDEGAFALLSSKARDAQREQFVTQKSDTIRWRVSQKSKEKNGVVHVWVDVEDYADSGDIQMDTLTFVIVKDVETWRVAGFQVGDLAVNFEDSVIASLDATEQFDDEPVPTYTATRESETTIR